MTHLVSIDKYFVKKIIDLSKFSHSQPLYRKNFNWNRIRKICFKSYHQHFAHERLKPLKQIIHLYKLDLNVY